MPDLLFFEKRLQQNGIERIAGVDEAGRGCLAGPVVAAAVVFPKGLRIDGVDDSKKLNASTRERLFDEIRLKAVSWAVASVAADEIDRINIHNASLKAMALAVSQLSSSPDYLLIDGRFPIPLSLPQQAVVKGDQKSHSIAAASIIAKVSRDRWMRGQGRDFPQFNFDRHKGYGTREHFDEIRRFGLSSIHRRSFRSSTNSANCAATGGIPYAARR